MTGSSRFFHNGTNRTRTYYPYTIVDAAGNDVASFKSGATAEWCIAAWNKLPSAGRWVQPFSLRAAGKK